MVYLCKALFLHCVILFSILHFAIICSGKTHLKKSHLKYKKYKHLGKLEVKGVFFSFCFFFFLFFFPFFLSFSGSNTKYLDIARKLEKRNYKENA